MWMLSSTWNRHANELAFSLMSHLSTLVSHSSLSLSLSLSVSSDEAHCLYLLMTWYLLVNTENTDGNIFSYRKFIAFSCDSGTQKSRDGISQKGSLQGQSFEYFFLCKSYHFLSRVYIPIIYSIYLLKA